MSLELILLSSTHLRQPATARSFDLLLCCIFTIATWLLRNILELLGFEFLPPTSGGSTYYSELTLSLTQQIQLVRLYMDPPSLSGVHRLSESLCLCLNPGSLVASASSSHLGSGFSPSRFAYYFLGSNLQSVCGFKANLLLNY